MIWTIMGWTGAATTILGVVLTIANDEVPGSVRICTTILGVNVFVYLLHSLMT
jgi:hypothetical protein